MKLSKTQQMIIDEAKRDIDKARACATFEEYFMIEYAPTFNSNYNTPEKCKERDLNAYNAYKGYWEAHTRGEVLTRCNSRTLKALEKAGAIEIVNDGRSGIDTIKVLNY